MGKAPRQEEERQWGRLPNVYRHAPTMEQLRQDPRIPFEALPPVVEAIVLAGPESHRFVRQDSGLWGELHAGVLTTGLVRGALGLYEKAAAKRLGIGSGRQGGRGGLHTHPLAGQQLTGHGELLRAYHHLRQPACDSSPDAEAVAAAAAHNAAAVVAWNAAKGGQAAGAAAGAPCSQDVKQDAAAAVTASDAAEAAAVGHSKGARRRLKKRQAQAAAALAAAGPAAVASASAWGVSEEQKLRKARALSSQGLLAICCSWGSAQEAAALTQLAAAFPTSQLAEVGLCRLQQHRLPPSWGFGPGSLPPIGASPDALVRHRPTSPAASSEAGAAAGAAAAAAAGVPAGNGTAQAAAGGAPAAIGPWDIDALLARLQLAGAGDGAVAASSQGGVQGGTSSSSSSSSSSNAGGGAGGDPLIEVVEIKNTCPFGASRRGGKRRSNEFAVADKGPRLEVPPEWVPQLQLHMLCAGTPSGLLVSRSATRGARVFRLRRDDELLRLMLLVISRLWREHVLEGRPPPADVFCSWREHHDMTRLIVQAARGAQLVAAIEDEHHLPGGDARWFLD